MACPLNDKRLPENDKPVSEIIEDYAADQDQWVSEFVGAFEKMLSNGYTDLQDAPASWDNVQCKLRKKVMTCQ